MSNKSRKTHGKSVVLLCALAVGMFGFAYALVPLYEVLCEVTGLNGKTSTEAAGRVEIDRAQETLSDREVTVQFLARVGNGVPWEFRPTENSLKVRLGEVHITDYYVRNRAAKAGTGQAIPSVAPGYAAKYLHKVECFCFNQQHLEGGEEIDMPVRFYVSADLPKEVKTLSLSYTLFQVPNAKEPSLPMELASTHL